MNPNVLEITEAAQAIHRREVRQARITRAGLLVFAAVMAVCAYFGCAALPAAGLRLAVMIGSGVIYLMSFSALVCSQWTIGMLPQAGIGAYFFSLAALWPLLTAQKPLIADIAIIAAAGLPGLLVLFFIVTCAVMLFASFAPAPRDEAFTPVVLGCKLKGDKPGRMLRRRLDRAARLMNKMPDSVCIVTGGRAPDSEYAEAEVMRRYLMGKGIPAERILAETAASTTFENFAFSRRIIAERGLPERVGIISDRFHQFRAARIARQAGLVSFPICCETAWYICVQFWMREVLCIAERVIRGHW